MSQLCDEGNYTAEVIAQAFSKTKNGTHQFVLRVRVAEGVERNLYMFLSESAIPYTKENLRRLGYSGNSLTALDPARPGFHSFIGQTVECYCKHEMYEGKTQEKWALSSNQGLRSDPLTSDESSKLDRMFGSASEPQRANPVRTGVIVNDHGLEVSDSDIPF